MAEDLNPEPESGEVDTSHELDMVTLFGSSTHDAEMEALAIQSLLQANGIQAVVVGASQIPSLEFQVRVAAASLPEAQRLLEEAKAAGPEAAEAAERASEDAV
jgi:aryl-alcohol dehydrogenase-like predicted oxidoreductase